MKRACLRLANFAVLLAALPLIFTFIASMAALLLLGDLSNWLERLGKA